MKRATFQRALVYVLGAALTVPLMHCGGGGGGGPSSTIGGNVSSPPSAMRERAERSWLAWIREEVLGFAKRAVAQGGIAVTARGAGGRVSGETAPDGSFELENAPTGDVEVSFQDGGCEASGEIPSLGGGCTLLLEDVDLDCSSIRSIGRIGEECDVVVENKPSSCNGNLNVCVRTADGIRNRVVNTGCEDFDAGEFEALQEGDGIHVVGQRSGLGAPSTLNADDVEILGPGNLADCTVPTPTPTPTSAAGATPTPTT